MDRSYDLSKKARSDLKDIWNYTEGRWGRRQADQYYRGIIQAIIDVVEGKREGKAFPIRPKYFKVKQEHHLIFFIRSDEGQIFVSRILHEVMDFPSHLDNA